jgi:hypothetical protein
MAKFTPGPWVVHGDFPEYVVPAADAHKRIGGSEDPEREAERYAKVVHFCDVEPNVRFNQSRTVREEAEANAHLIAAAPEMYDLLGELADLSCEAVNEGDPALIGSFVSSAKQLIARIDGEQP